MRDGWEYPLKETPSQDIGVEIDGHSVVIPKAPPIANPALKGSTSFSQSEYLLYKFVFVMY